ncbi:hypothetical protein CICLE_v10023202mg [Citrus x clementina]|uniref:Uncharacterized protein n=1 Tax=Citrus clementina TaxID=85681 RepID=V4VS96_CITCL|nr:hypothetical protein CICLE_v10023202mg [Citrus x clementina]
MLTLLWISSTSWKFSNNDQSVSLHFSHKNTEVTRGSQKNLLILSFCHMINKYVGNINQCFFVRQEANNYN